MKEFKTLISNSNGISRLTLSGDFNEHSVLPKINEKILHLDLDAVTMMNSYGIRTWSIWANEHQNLVKIVISNCPYVFIKHASSTKNFLFPNMEVISFYVPYTDDENNEAKDVLFVKDIDYFNDGTIHFPKILGENGTVLEPDVHKSIYFSFIKK